MPKINININVNHTNLTVAHLKALCPNVSTRGMSKDQLKDAVKKYFKSLKGLTVTFTESRIALSLDGKERKSVKAFMSEIERLSKRASDNAMLEGLLDEAMTTLPVAGAGAARPSGAAEDEMTPEQMQKAMMDGMQMAQQMLCGGAATGVPAAASPAPASADEDALVLPEPMNMMQAMVEGSQAMADAVPQMVAMAEGVNTAFDAGTRVANRAIGAAGTDSVEGMLTKTIDGVAGAATKIKTAKAAVSTAVETAKETTSKYSGHIKAGLSVAAGLGVAVGAGLLKAAFETAVESLGSTTFVVTTVATGVGAFVALNAAEKKLENQQEAAPST